MEEESFEDEEVAQLLNENFISIKVDREERPDIDSVYMTICQALTGSGGWPLTIIMTPDKEPFFAGTYFPKYTRYNRLGIMDLLSKISYQWKNNNSTLIKSSKEIMHALTEEFSPENKEGNLNKTIIKNSIGIYKMIFDKVYGGFGEAPKFPSPQNFMFLMDYYKFTNDEYVLNMVEKTLQGMYKGGLFDHIGFGFSRYSTDEKWLVPHFEKMLYDNALLMIVYIQAYEITKNNLYKDISIKTAEYIVREMRDEKGGFYCAQDADSDGEEGKYYVFNPLEIIEILGEKDGIYFNSYYDITEVGNFEGKSIPNLINNDDYDKIDEKINSLRSKVFKYRLSRTKLHKDDKILTSWNALMIVALSKLYKVTENEEYLNYIKECMNFIDDNLKDKDGRLLARYKDNRADYLAYLDDYAFLTWAYLETYESTLDINYLKEALKLNKETIRLFWDEDNFGFFIYGNDSEQLIARPKDLYDGAMPSGNSVQAYNLAKLAKISGDAKLEDIAYKQLNLYYGSIKKSPTGYSFYMLALMSELYESTEIICVFKEESSLTEIKSLLKNNYYPNVTILVKDINNENTNIDLLSNYHMKNNQTTYYVCKNNSCTQPFNEINKLKTYLE